jgi:acyl-coenzyme A synthetase/AMP-(fatty) acid ligase
MSHRNLEANTNSIIEYLSIDESERPITTLPMNYTYGLSIINTHLMAGATILMTEAGILQREFWQFFKEQEATSFGGVPYTYEMLKKLRFFRMDLPSLRTFTQAGGKLMPELHKEYAEYAQAQGKRFFIMYGATEATSRMSYLPWQRCLEKCGSMGIAIPGGEFSLIDVDGSTIDAPDTVGELVYKGKNVTLGYAEKREDLATPDERGGVLVTGDMAKRDKDGFYYIVGRRKRFLKIYGNRVNLDEVEGLLKKQGIDCACAGHDDNLRVYVTDEGAKEKAAAFIEEHTAVNRKGFAVSVIDAIPRNDAGKVLYSALNKLID